MTTVRVVGRRFLAVITVILPCRRCSTTLSRAVTVSQPLPLEQCTCTTTAPGLTPTLARDTTLAGGGGVSLLLGGAGGLLLPGGRAAGMLRAALVALALPLAFVAVTCTASACP